MPLRILRGLRLLSQLSFTPTSETLAQMRAEAGGLRHVDGADRRGVDADGMGEPKLLLGARPADALRLARTPARSWSSSPSSPMIGYGLPSERQPLPLDEHLFAVVQHTADAGAALAVRLCRLHDVGKPDADRRGRPCAARRADRRQGDAAALPELPQARRRAARRRSRVLARRADRRGLRAPLPRLEQHRRSRSSSSTTSAPTSTRSTSRRGSSSTWRPSLEARGGAPQPASARGRRGRRQRPVELGYREGPALGGELARLLDLVVDRPDTNQRAFCSRRHGAAFPERECRARALPPHPGGGGERTSPSSSRRSTCRSRSSECSRRPASRWWGEPRPGHRREARRLRRRSAGTSSGTCSRTRSRSSARSASSISTRLGVRGAPRLLVRRCSRSASRARRRRPGWCRGDRLVARTASRHPGPDDHAPARRRLGGPPAPWFRRLAELGAEHGLPELSMGTSQDWRVGVEEGRSSASDPLSSREPSRSPS